ncbi:MAG: alpha/beta hydrolase [Pleurocapsa sp.]
MVSRFLKLFLPLYQRNILIAVITIAGIIAFQSPTHPADNIYFNYSLLGFKVKVEDLELFAKEGKITRQLNFYLKRISPEQRKQFQEFLQLNYDIDPVLVYRFSRTSVGIKMLERVGEILQIPHNTNGFYGLRAAAVQTAADPEGVNIISFLKYFPTDLKLNLPELRKGLKELSQNRKETKEFISNLEQENKSNNKQVDLDKLKKLSELGKFSVNKQTLNIYNPRRQRDLITDLYLPQNSTSSPVIVISNGLGAKRDRFKELATHLASHGFAVVIPDHPGSDRNRQKAFLKGLYRENFDSSEFIDRPIDISYILDKLEQFNTENAQNKLNLKQVGVFGYSLGSTTALSLAGAEIDFQRLETKCSEQLNLLNISTLYQCRALELPRQRQSLQDERIKAAYMFVPFGNNLFGEQELQKVAIPTLWQTVDRDFLTSLLYEQLPAFNSLSRSDRYLVVSEKLPHTNVTLGKNASDSQQKTSEIAKKYQNALSLAFFKTYVAENPEYRSHLHPASVNAIAQPPYNLHILTK